MIIEYAVDEMLDEIADGLFDKPYCLCDDTEKLQVLTVVVEVMNSQE